MTDETTLLSCPFCGGEAIIWHGYFYGCKCVKCGCLLPVGGYETEAEAIAAWNTRAERTCYDASIDKTCQFYCSECECTVDVPLLWGALNYCPNCGCKVIGGDVE